MTFEAIINKVKNLFFTNKCGICKKVITENNYICDDCKKFLSVVSDNTYLKDSTWISKPFFDDISAPFYYEDGSKVAMVNLKFKGMRDNCYFFGEKMAEVFLSKYKSEDFDYIVYVPTTKNRLKDRGFNPPYLMAKKFSEISKIPILEDIFKRDNNSRTQHSLEYKDRFENADKSYTINNSKFSGKNFVLIDDICTTGATLNSLSKLLKENGAQKIVCSVGCIGRTSLQSLSKIKSYKNEISHKC